VRPNSSLWRSSSGILRSIKTARRLLEGPIGGVDVEVKSQLPKYVVVMTATDIGSAFEGDEAWLEDDDPEEDWAAVAKNFTKVRCVDLEGDANAS
jgi:hypothetical protein